ncbi:MAG TPA: amidase [Longimicrobiaceae bacterium]|nr:amidase [Longimicrobiaceae bacterium]
MNDTGRPEGPALARVLRPRSLRRAAAGLLLAAGAACAPAPVTQGAVAAAPGTAVAPFELDEATVAELQEGMRSGRYTSRSITEAYLARIEALDRRGPALQSMLDLNSDALAIADSLDAERRAGRVRGPLHGIPVVVKDNVDTADRMTTTAGSLALEGSIAQRDAFVAERLREAGAVILGKANLSEWANFRSTQSSSGWSGRGGQVRNPYALDRSPCGSSSGTAVAVAANLAPVGVGTETDGSIVCPAAANGLVGVKPTMGLVSRAGIIPIAGSQDIAGPMARTVTDAALLLGALAGADPRDPATAASRGKAAADYTRFLDPNGLRGARIGVVRKGFTGYSPETDKLFEEAVATMRRAGAVLVDSLEMPHRGEYGAAEYTVLLYEFKDELNKYLAGLGPNAPVKSLEEVIAFNEREAARSMPYFGQEILVAAQAKGPITEKEYLEAREKTRLAGKGIDSLMALHRLDAVVAPTGSPAWPIDLINGDHFLGASSTPAAVSGYPNVTVPMGFSFGLPVGVSFFGRAWSEPTLLRLAYAYEQATKHRAPPRFLPTVDLTVR